MEKIILTSITPEEIEEIFRKVIREEFANNKTLQIIENYKDPDELLKIDQVAEIFRVSAVTIHKWKSLGLIPFHKIHRRLFFKKSEVLNSLHSINIKRRY